MISLEVDVKSLQWVPGKLATGAIYFSIDGKEFPEKGWNDFLVIILNWWLSAILRIVNNGSTSESFTFMDGPFELHIEVTKDEKSLFLKGIHNMGECSTILISSKVKQIDFFKTIINTSEKVVCFCKSKNWDFKDLTELELAVSSLKKALEKDPSPKLVLE
ncbi:MAG: hypothetical protein CR997_11120 [Acidobacteria bacterium]|nr:MAG: hypothetical protein CR997_11120 [Acidobacteriota bacterium]